MQAGQNTIIEACILYHSNSCRYCFYLQ